MLMKMDDGTSRPDRLAKFNAPNQMDGIALLKSLGAGEAKAAFLDPQYRAILDKMKYGNEGQGREKDRAALPQMTDAVITEFVKETSRVLAPSGHLFLWIDKFSIGSGHHLRYLDQAPQLAIVDVVHWNKIRLGMGRRMRCVSEYVVVLQKIPTRAKGCWSDHRMLDSWTESSDRSVHPHAKPYQLTERLIRAVTKPGDLVVDPCAGSYRVLHACLVTGRQFVGCDLMGSSSR